VIKDVMLQASASPSVIEQVSHTTSVKPTTSEPVIKPERNVSTITLNDHLTRRLAQAPPQTFEPPSTPPRSIEPAIWTTAAFPAASPLPPKDMLSDFPKIEFPTF
jgi:hypothetical protein